MKVVSEFLHYMLNPTRAAVIHLLGNPFTIRFHDRLQSPINTLGEGGVIHIEIQFYAGICAQIIQIVGTNCYPPVVTDSNLAVENRFLILIYLKLLLLKLSSMSARFA